jgi:Domain of unknown function (DUF4397)
MRFLFELVLIVAGNLRFSPRLMSLDCAAKPMPLQVKKFLLPMSAASLAFVAASFLGTPAKLGAVAQPPQITKIEAAQGNGSTSMTDSRPSTTRFAQLRVSQWGPDRSPVDLSLDGRPWVSNVTTGLTSNYLAIPPGRHTVLIGPADQIGGAQFPNAAKVEIQLDSGSRATLFPRPVGMSPPAILVSDLTPPVAPGSAHVRVINLSEQQGTVWVSSNNGLQLTSERRRSTSYVLIEPGDHMIRVGTSPTGPYLSENSLLSVAADGVQSIVVADAGPGVEVTVIRETRGTPGESTTGVASTNTQAPSTVGNGTAASPTASPTSLSTSSPTASPGTNVESLPAVDRVNTAVPSTIAAARESETTETNISAEARRTANSPSSIEPEAAQADPDETPASEIADGTVDQPNKNELALTDEEQSGLSQGQLLFATLQGVGLTLAASEIIRRLRR